ncbi:MAG: glycosyltransferase family 9 protein [Nitrospiraceae bacterium]|nr:glycosyltransferase family 9 protein [Nitrospiraceae bacterium]
MLGRTIKDVAFKAIAGIGTTLAGPSKPLHEFRSPRRILVFQAGGVGDIIRIFPLLESLKATFPASELCTLSPFHTTVFGLLPDPAILSRSFGYNPTKDHRTLAAKLALARQIRNERFDLIVNPARGQGMLQHAVLTFLFGAPIRVGFDHSGAGFANNVRIPLTPDEPILHQNLNLLRTLGIAPRVNQIRIRVPESECAALDTLLGHPIDRLSPLIALHPGSTWESRLQWNVSRYAELLSCLLRRYDGTILLLGTAPERHIGQKLTAHLASPRVVNLIGTTTLPQVTALISRCALFIGNDSGLLHIALGLRTPSIGLFGYTSPRQVICPDGPCVALHKPGESHLYEHQPFFTLEQPGPNPLDHIQVTDVLEAAASLLGDEAASSPSDW